MYGSVCRRSSTALVLTAVLAHQAPAVACGSTTRYGHVGAADRAPLSGVPSRTATTTS